MLVTPVAESTFAWKTLGITLQKMDELNTAAQKAIIYTGNQNSAVFQEMKAGMHQKVADANAIEVNLFAPVLLDEHWSTQEIQDRISDYIIEEMDQELGFLLQQI